MAYKAKKKIKYVGQFVIGLLMEIIGVVGFVVLTLYEFRDARFMMHLNRFTRLFSMWDSLIGSLGIAGGLVVHELVYGVVALALILIGHRLVKGSRSYV